MEVQEASHGLLLHVPKREQEGSGVAAARTPLETPRRAQSATTPNIKLCKTNTPKRQSRTEYTSTRQKFPLRVVVAAKHSTTAVRTPTTSVTPHKRKPVTSSAVTPNVRAKGGGTHKTSNTLAVPRTLPSKNQSTSPKNNRSVIHSLFNARTVKSQTCVSTPTPKSTGVRNHNNNIVVKASPRPARAPPAARSPAVPRIHITVRRGGQGQTASTKGLPAAATAGGGGPLKEASSISSLDSKHKIAAPLHPSKLAKAGSKEKLDKVSQQKNERAKNAAADTRKPATNNAGVLKNNNRIDFKETTAALNGDTRNRDLIGPTSLPGTLEVCDAEIVMQELVSVQQELEIMAKEKASLALELASYQGEVHALRGEMVRLQSYQDQHAAEIEHLSEENESLRCRLRDVAHSPLSDNEKQQLLDTHRQHNSAPASFAAPHEGVDSTTNGAQSSGAASGGDAPSSCPTPDWDKHSSSSMSEVSVACLQDRILQMEETHYSTNEELQATLQELADLQTQLLELQSDNERLSDEKTVLLESLCRQTEKLEDSRATVDTLQELLIRGDGQEQQEVGTEREQKLVDLLKAAQEERETLISKQNDVTTELNDLRVSTSMQSEERERLVDRVRLLETSVDSVHAERKLVDQELAQAKEQSSARRIEISRLTTLLENARAKIDELEKERDQGDRSEMDALLDTARKEKDTLESQVATLQGQVSRGQCEKERLKEQLSLLQEECKVAKNNAKSVISDLEYQLSEARKEVTTLRGEVQSTHDSAADAQAQVQRHLEDKRSLKATLAEAQRNLTDVEQRLHETVEKLKDEERLRKEENLEWVQFQRDLLMTVRVANDFKTEAQCELEKLVHENKALRDKVRSLEAQLEKLKAVKPQTPPLLRQSSVPVETQQSVFTSVQQEMAARRQKAGATRQDSRLSVKSLIESIENATKQVKAGPGGSHSSSTSSLNSIASDVRSSSTTPSTGAPPQPPMAPSGGGDWNEEVFAKSPLREQQQVTSTGTNRIPRTTSGKNLISDVNFGGKSDGGKQEDSIRESVAILSAKNIDFVRRNSYGDLSERKDPLNGLVKNGGSKRNALLKWCQQKTVGYRNIDITNFSSSWNDGLALCAILHTYLPDRVPYDTLVPTEKRRNFSLAFAAAESVGIPTTLNINDMCQLERPDWQQVMAYVTAIYKHFET